VDDFSATDQLHANPPGIGIRHGGGAVAAEQDGFVVFPNPHATLGNEWFYLAQLSKTT
jgi:hypothetical protein